MPRGQNEYYPSSQQPRQYGDAVGHSTGRPSTPFERVVGRKLTAGGQPRLIDYTRERTLRFVYFLKQGRKRQRP